jgi:hypothetical protein
LSPCSGDIFARLAVLGEQLTVFEDLRARGPSGLYGGSWPSPFVAGLRSAQQLSEGKPSNC